MDTNAATFGAILRRMRLSAALSQEELAERAGLSVRGISDLERGARVAPHPNTVRLLADALLINAEDRATLLAAARPPLRADRDNSIKADATMRLPNPLTRLIGREAQTAALRGLLSRNVDGKLVR